MNSGFSPMTGSRPCWSVMGAPRPTTSLRDVTHRSMSNLGNVTHSRNLTHHPRNMNHPRYMSNLRNVTLARNTSHPRSAITDRGSRHRLRWNGNGRSRDPMSLLQRLMSSVHFERPTGIPM
jgi:hypothetical protein